MCTVNYLANVRISGYTAKFRLIKKKIIIQSAARNINLE